MSVFGVFHMDRGRNLPSIAVGSSLSVRAWPFGLRAGGGANYSIKIVGIIIENATCGGIITVGSSRKFWKIEQGFVN